MFTHVPPETSGRDATRRTRDRLLFALTGSSGAIDAISFLALGHVFTAFMTGNVVFLGLRLAGSPTPSAVALLASIVAFALGAYVATRIVSTSSTEIWPRRVTAALTLSLAGHLVFSGIWLGMHGAPSPGVTPVLLVAWALAMGMQSGAIRALRIDAVYTTAVTGVVIYLAGDLTHRQETRAQMRRLAGILLCLFGGAVAGGWLVQVAPTLAPLLPLAITLAVVIIAYTAPSLR